MSLEHQSLSKNMHDNEQGQTKTNWKVNNLYICRQESKHTRRVIIFPKFMRDSALFRIVEVLFNGRQTEWREREVPDKDYETHRLMYHQVQRTVTDNHVQQVYASPSREGFVQREGEYHTVIDQFASPCDSSDWLLELLVNK